MTNQDQKNESPKQQGGQENNTKAPGESNNPGQQNQENKQAGQQGGNASPQNQK
jgi:hypothetical protein